MVLRLVPGSRITDFQCVLSCIIYFTDNQCVLSCIIHFTQLYHWIKVELYKEMMLTGEKCSFFCSRITLPHKSSSAAEKVHLWTFFVGSLFFANDN